LPVFWSGFSLGGSGPLYLKENLRFFYFKIVLFVSFFISVDMNIVSKQLGAIFIVAGTAIGGGVIALPIMIAKLGILWGVVLMLGIWVVAYYTAIVNVELNLQAGKGLPIGQLGALFSGKIASLVGVGSLKLLMFSLMSVYIYGLTSLFREVFHLDQKYFAALALLVSLCTALTLLLSMRFLDYVNRILFVGALVVAGVLILGLSRLINGERIPFLVGDYGEFGCFYFLWISSCFLHIEQLLRWGQGSFRKSVFLGKFDLCDSVHHLELCYSLCDLRFRSCFLRIDGKRAG
jgi:tyrosine-specific transport protein